MAITLDGATGITAPGVTDTGNLSVTGTSTLTGAATSSAFIPTGSTVPANGMYLSAANTLNFATNTTNQMSISSIGNLLVGTTSATINNSNSFVVLPSNGGAGGVTVTNHLAGSASGAVYAYYGYNGASIGGVVQNGTTAVSYNTTSDYRLKENVTPITVGLATVSALKPVTYDWVGAEEKGEGFIAHELQTVIPHAVTGEKDAVDAEGNPVYQGVDYSKIVVHLVAAIQELSAEVEALKAKVGA